MKCKTRQILLNGVAAMWMLMLFIGLLMAEEYGSNKISTYEQQIESKEVITIERVSNANEFQCIGVLRCCSMHISLCR